MSMNRRDVLRGISGAALSTATMTALGGALTSFQQASAADVSGYKALVCVFLLGGVDNHDVLLPYDQPSYDRFSEIRSSLMADYEAQPNASRRREDLLELTPVNADAFGGRQFALPPELSGLHTLFQEGNAAIVGNVGPLIQPLSRTEWDARTVATPKRLFSHNDQQSTWMASAPEGAQYGWGGRFADAALASGANGNRDFTAITSLGNELFLTGQRTSPYQVGLNGSTEVELLRNLSDSDVYDDIRRHFRAADFNADNLIQQDVARISRNAVDLNELYNEALDNLVPLSTEFPRNFIGRQLQAIANTIAIRDNLSMSRQVFFAAREGFDTHSTQARELPLNLGEVNDAIIAFYRAMQELGLGDSVTLFTASDFGRTLAINGDGTDHGWGGHHFVVGNAIAGQTIYGDVPPAEFDHDYDAGSGRLIPTTSVEQFAEPLGRWFGLNDNELAAALPNFNNFSSQEQLKKLFLSSS